MAKIKVVAGMDLGFRKTGITIFHMTLSGNLLKAATTITANEEMESNSSLRADLNNLSYMQTSLKEYFEKHGVTAIFAEFPVGGSKNGRAARCMGMATAMAHSFFQSQNYACEILSPIEIEKALSLNISGKEKQALGLKASALKKRRKALLKQYVIERFPDFDDWPSRVAEAEDAYDSAAAFMAAEFQGPDCLYSRIVAELKKEV